MSSVYTRGCRRAYRPPTMTPASAWRRRNSRHSSKRSNPTLDNAYVVEMRRILLRSQLILQNARLRPVQAR